MPTREKPLWDLRLRSALFACLILTQMFSTLFNRVLSSLHFTKLVMSMLNACSACALPRRRTLTSDVRLRPNNPSHFVAIPAKSGANTITTRCATRRRSVKTASGGMRITDTAARSARRYVRVVPSAELGRRQHRPFCLGADQLGWPADR